MPDTPDIVLIRQTPLSRALCCHEFLSDLIGSFDYLRKLWLVRNHNLNFGFYEAFTKENTIKFVFAKSSYLNSTMQKLGQSGFIWKVTSSDYE